AHGLVALYLANMPRTRCSRGNEWARGHGSRIRVAAARGGADGPLLRTVLADPLHGIDLIPAGNTPRVHIDADFLALHRAGDFEVGLQQLVLSAASEVAFPDGVLTAIGPDDGYLADGSGIVTLNNADGVDGHRPLVVQVQPLHTTIRC